MLNIAICDDDMVLCSQLEEILLSLQRTKQFEIEVFYTGEELLRFISEGSYFDIIFLDIEFRTTSGIEIGKKIRDEINDEMTQIVYISGKESYAMELFEIRPLNFLIKPLQEGQIEQVLKKAMKIIDRSSRFFDYKNGRTLVRVPVKDILYFESSGKRVRIIAQNETHEFYGKLSDISRQLSSNDFVQIHKSYLVNYFHIISYQYERIRLTNKQVLAISQQNRKSVGNWLLNRRKEEAHEPL